jgi:hypothetical protein
VEELANLMVKMSSGEVDLEGMGKASRDIISGWTPEIFAENMVRAAEVAFNSPQPKINIIDKMLLTALMYK